MSRSPVAPHLAQPATIDLRWPLALCRRLAIATVAVMLLLGAHAIGVAHAAGDYVYSIGVLVKIDQGAITLGFQDGSTETYRIGRQTTFQSQNADQRTFADLAVGNPVVVIAAEGDQTAFTVIDGGPSGFHEAGPADIRGHEGTCAGCGAESAEHS
jgi:hypothetical protein